MHRTVPGTPFHVADETEDWLPVPASPPGITPGGALDVSFLSPTPAGREGAVTVKDGRLTLGRGAVHGSWASA